MSARIDAAYEYCREITRREASSFYYGFLLLPPAQRRAIYSAYAFARQCDDIADGDLPRDEAEWALDGARDALDRSLAGDPDGPVFEALGRTIERYDVPLQHFIDVIDGVRMDLTVSRYATFTDLRAYCYRVASSVGLISIEIFGYSGGQRARQYATDLGIALQLTNILRDVAEDADRGRVYLPQEEVEWFGYSDAELLKRKVTPEFRRLIAYQVHRARLLCQRSAPAAASTRSRACLRRRDGGHPWQHSRRDRAAAGRHLPPPRRSRHRPEASPRRARACPLGHAMTDRPAVLVAGGGLAGITAACELADAGVRVKLIEKRPYLGGRSYSYEADGVEVDNGQHVFLGCCTAYIALLERLGVRDGVHLQRRFRVPVIDKVWGESVLQSASLPPPAHLVPSLLRFKSLSPREKALAAYAFTQMRSTDLAKHPELDDITFEQWLLDRRQSRHAIRSLWNLIVQPTLNDRASRVSAALALMVFQEGFLRTRDGANVGWAKMGLSLLLAGAAREYIESRGGEVLTTVALNGLEMSGDDVSRALTDAGDVTADAYVIALAPGDVPAVLPDAIRDDRFFARIGQISTSPIVNVHLWYERSVWDRAFAAFLNTPVQWVFNKSKLWRQDGPQYLVISLSGAREWVDVPAAEIRDHFEKEMRALLPAARGVDLVRALVVKQRDATFAAHAGVARLRPAQRTSLSNLFLAGDWTDTGWPATMESAVRSGASAALEAMRSLVRSEKQVGAV